MNIRDTFQRAMDITFRGLSGHYVVMYLDDVTIFSKRREDHVFHLKEHLRSSWRKIVGTHHIREENLNIYRESWYYKPDAHAP